MRDVFTARIKRNLKNWNIFACTESNTIKKCMGVVPTARIKRNLKNGNVVRRHRNATQVAIVMEIEKKLFCT